MKKLIILFIVPLLFACSTDSNNDNSPEMGITTTINISNFSASIDENPTEGTSLGTINAITNQGTISFSILEQSPGGAISIDNTNGEISVADSTIFDYEINTMISGTIQATNGDVNETATFSIQINDVAEENIFEGNILLLTQEEVNNFGANQYTQITGILRVGTVATPNSSIIDLSPLSTIQRVNDLNIIANESLENLTGLENLTFVLGWIRIGLNTNLESITSLSSINNELNREIFIWQNPNLLSLQGLNNIPNIRNLNIEFNPLLTDLNALSDLFSIEDSRLVVRFNDNLSDLCGIQNAVLNSNIEPIDYFMEGNLFNPTLQDFEDGNCSL